MSLIEYNDIIKGFQRKFSLWCKAISIGNYSFFTNLNNIQRNIEIKTEILQHLHNLDNLLTDRFSILSSSYKDFFCNPFEFDVDLLPEGISEEFIDFSSNSILKSKFNAEKYVEFWCQISLEYPSLGRYVLSVIVPFGSTYLSECAFSSLIFIKNMYRNKIDVLPQLLISNSNIPHDWNYWPRS